MPAEGRPHARGARAAAARRRARHVRRRPPRPPPGDRGRGRGRADADGRHLRPAPAARARQRGRAARDARAAARAARRARRRGDARRRVHARARSGSSRRSSPSEYLAAIGAERGRRRRGLPLRAQAARRPRRCSRGSASTRGRCRCVEGVSSSAIRHLLHDGDVGRAAALLGRPPEVEGWSSRATRAAARSASRPRTSRRPGAARAPARHLRRVARPVTARRSRSATNPHYGGDERRIEAFLLDFAGDLYGQRLVVELWQRLRDERVFDERAGAGRADRPRRRRDEAGRAARLVVGRLPVTGDSPVAAESLARDPSSTVADGDCPRCTAPPRIRSRSGASDRADAAEVVVPRRPASHCQPAASSSASAASSTPGSALTVAAGPMDARAGRPPPGARGPRRGRPKRPRRAPFAAASRRPRRSRAPARRRRGRCSAPSCSASGLPGSSGPTSRSTSPSMLFRCRSRPGSQSPEPSPRLVVRTHALPSRVDRHEVRRVPVGPARPSSASSSAERARGLVEAGEPRKARRASRSDARQPAAGQEPRAGVGDLDGLGPDRLVRRQILARDHTVALGHEPSSDPRSSRGRRSPRPRRRPARAPRTSPGCSSRSPGRSSRPSGA